MTTAATVAAESLIAVKHVVEDMGRLIATDFNVVGAAMGVQTYRADFQSLDCQLAQIVLIVVLSREATMWTCLESASLADPSGPSRDSAKSVASRHCAASITATIAFGIELAAEWDHCPDSTADSPPGY